MGEKKQDDKHMQSFKERSAKEFAGQTKGLEPIFNTLQTARYRYVLLVVIVASLAGLLWFGFKDAGSYYGYTAGSLFRPDRYAETAATEYFGEWQGLTADEVNRQVSSMRLANLPGALGCGAVLAAAGVFSWWAGLGFALARTVVKSVFDLSADTRSFFVRRYRADHPAAPGNPKFSNVMLYTLRYVFDPACDNGVADTLLDAEMVGYMRKALGDVKVSGGYLLANGLWLSGSPARLRPALSFIGLDPITVAHASRHAEDAGAPPAAQESATAPAEDADSAPAGPQPDAPEKDASGSASASVPAKGAPALSAASEPAAPAAAASQSVAPAETASEPAAPVAAVRRFCAQCGAKLPDGARFCPRCGTPRDTGSAPRSAGGQISAPAKDAGAAPVSTPKDGSLSAAPQPQNNPASGAARSAAAQPVAASTAPASPRPSRSRAPIVAAVCVCAAALALVFVIVVLPALGPTQTPDTAGTVAADGTDVSTEALPRGAAEDGDGADDAPAQDEGQAEEGSARRQAEEPADTDAAAEPADAGSSDLLALSDPAQIAASLGPASDGATGTYENIPDTPATQLWKTCMPQGPVAGLEYEIALDGSYMRIAAQRSQSGADDVMRYVLSELGATTDMFFQVAHGRLAGFPHLLAGRDQRQRLFRAHHHPPCVRARPA